ncbi:hypothetical protein BDZ89DRAFT_811759 [Hymenopellis radicata]|nr:hypothetical protein BDZ89DRAFT_811759 [Hymenopellis radicata]
MVMILPPSNTDRDPVSGTKALKGPQVFRRSFLQGRYASAKCIKGIAFVLNGNNFLFPFYFYLPAFNPFLLLPSSFYHDAFPDVFATLVVFLGTVASVAASPAMEESARREMKS